MPPSSIETNRRSLAGFLIAQMKDGWWPYHPGQQPAIEATSWCALALKDDQEVASKVLNFLAGAQNSDGGWSTTPGAGSSDWNSGPALMAVGAIDKGAEFDFNYNRGITYLTDHRANLFSPFAMAALGVLEDLADKRYPQGWPWTYGSFHWVEPTSYAIIALKLGRHSRRPEIEKTLKGAENFLFEFSCKDGGWNHGNSQSFGVFMPAYPQTTGEALVALQDYPQEQVVADGMRYIATAAVEENTVISLSWAILALQALSRDITPLLNALKTHQKPDGSFGNNLMANGLAGCALAAAANKNPLKFDRKLKSRQP